MDTQNPKPSLLSEQPDPKRPKPTTPTPTSSANPTTSVVDTASATTTTPSDTNKTTQTTKRRKIALIFAYLGANYQGMQRNPGAKTIEADLFNALLLSGVLHPPSTSPSSLPHPNSFDWARSARTDKGVSAVGQVCSGRFYINLDEFIEKLNSNLPVQIRVFGFKRVQGSFNAQRFCDRRRYVYLIPVFALDGDAHGGDGDGVCVECLESGRNVERVLGKGENSRLGNVLKRELEDGNSESSVGCVDGDLESGNLSKRGCDDGNLESGNLLKKVCVDGDIESGNLAKKGCVDGNFESGNLANEGCEDGNIELGNLSNIKCKDGNFESGDLLNSGCGLNQLRNDVECVSSLGNVVADKLEEMKDGEDQHDEHKVCGLDGNKGVVEGKRSKFCYGEKEKERFNRVLKNYEGTHTFHNFTSRITAQDPSAKRYIVSFSANTTVTVDGIEFVKCEVVGQSFLLHQIRKMIGLAVVIMRGIAPESLIRTAFRKDMKINVPVAPEVGLYLDECFFTPYNKKRKDGHDEVSMKAYTEEAEDFKMKYIYPHIASTERKEGTVALWLHYLNHHNYPDLCIGACTGDEKAEPQDLLARNNNETSSAVNIEVEKACLGVNGSSGGDPSAENIVVKDVNDGNNDSQNVEVKDTAQ